MADSLPPRPSPSDPPDVVAAWRQGSGEHPNADPSMTHKHPPRPPGRPEPDVAAQLAKDAARRKSLFRSRGK